MKTPDETLAALKRGVVDLLTEDELRLRLADAARTGKPLRVKLGLDPTAADVHLGFTVVLRKLRQFQDLGHKAVLIIGDYTALVGDPSGKSKTRPQLDYAVIERNFKTYLDQVRSIIRTDEAHLEVRFNGEWFKELPFREVISLAGHITVARVLERDDFARRFQERQPIGLHELIYPLMQAYDSVRIEADVELGGTDQLFNLVAGRDLMRDMGLKPQIALTLPLLIGLDGTDKMSKSLGNAIGVRDDPRSMFGKTMSIPDALLENWFTLLTDRPIDDVRRRIAENPRDAKWQLAADIVTQYHGTEAAAEQRRLWEQQVSDDRYVPPDAPEICIAASELDGNKLWAVRLLVLAGHASTNGEARRLIQGGGVRYNFEAVTDDHAKLTIHTGDILKTGKKRWARMRIG